MSPHISTSLQLLKTAGAALLVLAGASAHAHDTWFEPRSSSRPGSPELILATGNQFPVFENPVGIEHLVTSGCRGGGMQNSPLRDVDAGSPHLVLGPTRSLPRQARLSCWAQLQAFEVELDDELIDLYFKEAQPPAAVVQAWREQKARGIRWRERYVKHARVEWDPPQGGEDAGPALPVPMEMDALMESPGRRARVGEELVFRVLNRGVPMAGFAVEFRHQHSRFGLWRRTDAEGRVRLPASLPGRWLLRGIELTPPASDSQPWQGRFLTLAFEVGPPAGAAPR